MWASAVLGSPGSDTELSSPKISLPDKICFTFWLDMTVGDQLILFPSLSNTIVAIIWISKRLGSKNFWFTSRARSGRRGFPAMRGRRFGSFMRWPPPPSSQSWYYLLIYCIILHNIFIISSLSKLLFFITQKLFIRPNVRLGRRGESSWHRWLLKLKIFGWALGHLGSKEFKNIQILEVVVKRPQY